MKLQRALLFATIYMLVSITRTFASDVPDPQLTPGAIDSAVTQENIQSTVCTKGYTKRVRPPASFTNKLKKNQIREYGLADTNPKHYEEDHLISLGLGGDPLDRKNLWPEPWHSEWNARRKDELENALHRMVCDGEITLKDAQTEIAGDWISAYKKYVP